VFAAFVLADWRTGGQARALVEDGVDRARHRAVHR
jgi:hypothetical protein